ncbi:MAG: ATP-dependent helicase [Rhodothermia bacterium]|nr:MAG: ATP-dependent helicase [Rhodothermia bacterium]
MTRRFVIKSDPARDVLKLTINYGEELNTQQHSAATAGRGPVLVVAGAGTGKTRTLVYRVAYLVETGTPPEQIVLLTFTRRASREMISRASILLDGRCQNVRGGTFHSFCLSILRQHAPKIGFPNNFTIMDSTDSADVVDVVRSGLSIKKTRRRLPRKRTIQSIISGVRNRDTTIQEYVELKYPQFVEYIDVFVDISDEYARYKRSHGLMDYDDLLLHSLFLLEEHEDIRKRVAGRCRHVLVDEYQDTNQTQAALVRAFSSEHGNIMVVGDDAQSIYQFRGADFRNILSFPQQFPQTVTLKLEHNYRSTQRILDLANHVIATARHKFEKKLFTDKEGGELPVLVQAADNRFESRFVTQQILELRENGIPLNQIAVLFRNGFNSYDLEVELNRCGIPFVKYGGMKLSEAAHIKDVLAHLKVLENPLDSVSWNRILQLLEGVGPKTAHRIIEWTESGAHDAFQLDETRFSPRYIESLRALFDVLRRVLDEKRSITKQLERIVAYYEPILKRVHYDDHPKRLQDLEHFIGIAESFPDRATLLSSLALDPIELTAIDTEPIQDDEPPLILSTIHSAKGLEFDTVFLIHALDGILPSAYSVDDSDALDEELRLLYVAVTRAAVRLFISYPTLQYRRYEGRFFASPSRFLDNIPASLLDEGSIVEEAAPLSNESTIETEEEFQG